MDSQAFVSKASEYYCLAIAMSFVRQYSSGNGGRAASFYQISRAYLQEDLFGDKQSVLDIQELMYSGAERAQELGIIRALEDEFGPTLLRLAEHGFEKISELSSTEGTLFEKYALAGTGAHEWLLEALENIKKRWQESGEGNGPVQVEDSTHDVWEPIPLERNDETLEEATAALDETIDQLRADNGYAIAHSEEKAYVLDTLKQARKRLGEDAQISWMYLKEFAFKPLGVLIGRFGQAAIGIAATAAKDALLAWLKKKGIGFLDDLF